MNPNALPKIAAVIVGGFLAAFLLRDKKSRNESAAAPVINVNVPPVKRYVRRRKVAAAPAGQPASLTVGDAADGNAANDGGNTGGDGAANNAPANDGGADPENVNV